MFTRELCLMSRKKITLLYARRYRKARRKKEKSEILNEFVNLTGYNRSYASWLLRHAGKRVYRDTPGGRRMVLVADPRVRIRRKRKKIYDGEVLVVLRKVWEILDYPCSQKLKAMLGEIISVLEYHGEIEVTEEVREKLLRISRSTIDRLLRKEREKSRIKPRSRTKPGSLLKRQIPIRTHRGWNEGEPGFIEVDLISHDGGMAKGEFAYTLVLTDVHTQWTEMVPVRNKAQRWTFEALLKARGNFPFPVKGIDSDNDGAFINYHLLKWTQENGIIFTRSRPYWSNDNCHVEQKNWSVGRRYLGYFRYDTEKALGVLAELSEQLRFYVNFFIPSVKLVKKIRTGSKTKKIYDSPKTPFQRLLEHPGTPEDVKQRLRQLYRSLNPAELHRRIKRLQRMLFSSATQLHGVDYE